METLSTKPRQAVFHPLKVAKKEQLNKNTFMLEFEIPAHLKSNFQFEAGQYVTVKYQAGDTVFQNDYSMTSAPFEQKITLGIKISSDDSSANVLFNDYKVGDVLEVSEPRGRFTITSKPHEFRTIIGFAGGIGITPLLSHFKNILHSEPRTRLFLFYGNRRT